MRKTRIRKNMVHVKGYRGRNITMMQHEMFIENQKPRKSGALHGLLITHNTDSAKA